MSETEVRAWPSASVGTGLGLLAALLALGAAAGGDGVALWVAVAAGTLVLTPPMGFALAHAGLLLLFPNGLDAATLALVEGGLFVLLFASFGRSPAPGRTLGMSAAAAFGLLGFSRVVAVEMNSTAAGAAFVVVAGGALLYTIHRFERVGVVLTAGEDR
ncbi:hypothetical protein [Halogeometricum sp. CBA1124]|uniref:hypothetical protein n=1 Tax=Halogeometricum sp. CBA1124 TaxID=2668071 RepID=UPI00142A8577|nr:hypothetical protein [Halogeometricum sp. CBA1124]MUV57103.1 hypothetical protein [Halogeometricum sp. CBA1124]